MSSIRSVLPGPAPIATAAVVAEALPGFAPVAGQIPSTPILASGFDAGIGSALGAAVRLGAAEAAKPPSKEELEKLSKEEQQRLDFQKKIDEALAKNDLGSLRYAAAKPEILAAATPEQKAAMAAALSRDVLSKKDGDNDARRAIAQILGSAQSDDEARTILEGADPALVQEAMQQGVKEPRKDGLIAQFDIVAGARGCSEYAVVPENAERAEEALARGYTPDQIVAARKNVMDSLGNDDRSKACAEDPLAMLVAVPAEKSQMIRRLMDGWTTDSEDRAMASILESCGDKAEFDEVVDGAGGRGVIDEMDDDEAKKKFNRLAGAYGRMDLVTIPQEAAKTYGVLVDPDAAARLLGGATAEIVRAERAERTGDPADDFIAQQKKTTHARVLTLDRRAQVDTILENAAREKDGKPLIDPQQLRGQVEEILSDPSIKPEDKDKRVDELRKQQGLDDYTMRNIATQPLARIFENATRDSAQFAAVGEYALEQRLRQAVALTGGDSFETFDALLALEEFRRKMGVNTKDLSAIAKKLDDLYPPPVSFWESFGNFMLGIAMNFAPMLLNLIPGVGTALYAGFQVAKGIYDAATGNLLGGLLDVANVLPGLGTAGSIASTAIKAGVGVEQAIEHGDLSAGLGALASAAGGFANVGGDFGRMAGTAKDVLESARQGAGIVDAAVHGDVAGALGGAAGLAGRYGGSVPAFAQLSDFAQRGSQLASAIQSGDLARALGTAAGWAGLDPAAARIAQQGAGVIQNLANGNLAGTLSSLSGALGEFGDSPALRQLSDVAQQGARFAGAIQSGDLSRTLSGGEALVQSLGGGPAVEALRDQLRPFERVLGDVQRSGLFQAFASGGAPSASQLAAALGVVGGAKDFVRSVASGDFAGALRAVGEQAARASENPVLGKALELVRDGTAVVGALQQGRFSDALDRLGVARRAGLDARALRDAEQLVGALTSSALGGRVRGEDARTLVRGLESFVRQLGGGQALGAIERYRNQLELLARRTAARDFLADFEGQARQVQALFEEPEALGGALLREIAAARRGAPAPVPVSSLRYQPRG